MRRACSYRAFDRCPPSTLHPLKKIRLKPLNHLRKLCVEAEPRPRVNFFWFTIEENISPEEASLLLDKPIWFVPADTEDRVLL